MGYRSIGATGVTVSHLCLGAMMFGAWGRTDHGDSVGIIRAALDGGVNCVDTADVYSARESEEIVGRALKGRRDNVVLATKFHGRMGPGSRGPRNWAGRFDTPEGRRKLDLVEELLELASGAGMSPTHMAQAWAVGHPAVSSAIIGPRTMEQRTDLLAGQDTVLDEATLDRIDELVPPGTNVDRGDAGWTPPALDTRARRRP
jgi:aryl-alcohol dehydrogenase-like predicted oxidoreductase